MSFWYQVARFPFVVVTRWYIASSKSIKLTQKILENAQQMSIIANVLGNDNTLAIPKF